MTVVDKNQIFIFICIVIFLFIIIATLYFIGEFVKSVNIFLAGFD